MSTSPDISSAFFFPLAPVPSTSSLSPPTAPSPGSAAQTQPHTRPYTGTFAGKKLSCITCRKGKAKCIWIDGTDSCELCLKRGLVCPGSAAPQRKTKQPQEEHSASPSSTSSDGAVDWDAIAAFLQHSPSTASSPGSIHSLCAASSTSTAFDPAASPSYNSALVVSNHHSHQRPAFSPYQTAAGRPRVLGPSSSEGSLNGIARAHLLKGELVGLYRQLWSLELPFWPVNTFSDFLDHPTSDSASRAMVSIAAAGGARSSPHSELLGEQGPSIHTVDEDITGQLTPGGFSQWGLRRHGSNVTLARKAIQETMVLLQRAPTVRSLKVALAAIGLYNGLYNDRTVMRPFVLVVIETWRAIRASAATTDDEQAWLVSKAGPLLWTRDCYHSINIGGPLAFRDDEVDAMTATFDELVSLDCFGLPALPAPVDVSVVVFEESLIYHAFYRTELGLLHSVVHIFANGDDRARFGTLAAANLASMQDMVDRIKQPLLGRLEHLLALDRARVFVLHEWTGSWRPKCMKEHAVVIINELIHDLYTLDVHVYGRLQLEHARGRIELDLAATGLLLTTARERCRRAIKFFAQSIERLMPTPRKHATFSNSFHHLIAAVGWVELTLGRYGEPDGPLAREDELTLGEVDWLVRAFRVGSYTQSTLVVPLRELEAGLEGLRARLGESVEDGLSCSFAGL